MAFFAKSGRPCSRCREDALSVWCGWLPILGDVDSAKFSPSNVAHRSEVPSRFWPHTAALVNMLAIDNKKAILER